MAVNTNPINLIELLEVYRIALSYGLINKEEVMNWADDIIKNDDEPDYLVIELSLIKNKTINDIIVLINHYLKNEKPQISIRIIFGLLYHRYMDLKITLKQVVSILYRFCLNEDITEIEKNFIYGLDDEYNLAIDKIYGTIEDVELHTIRFLEIYKDFKIDNFNEWKAIDLTIDQKLNNLKEIITKEFENSKNLQNNQADKKWWKFW